MCMLFGLSSSEKVRVNSYLKELMSHSPDHPNGWGIAAFYGDAVNLEKEPKTAVLSDYLETRLAHPIDVRNMIAHIRQATRGEMSYENCHPFVKRDAFNRGWTLAHNGTVFQSDLLDDYCGEQEGETDSERILCHIIRKMNEAGNTDAKKRFEVMDRIILEISENNKVNILIYDGELFYVHTNMQNTLYRTERDGAVLFATVALDDGIWEPVPMMQLLAYKEGKLLYRGTVHAYEYQKPDEVFDTDQ